MFNNYQIYSIFLLFNFSFKEHGNEHLFLNPYDRARATLLEAFRDLNKFQKLNSQNLQFMIETMISMVSHSLGAHNKTIKAFGQVLFKIIIFGISNTSTVGNRARTVLRHALGDGADRPKEIEDPPCALR